MHDTSHHALKRNGIGRRRSGGVGCGHGLLNTRVFKIVFVSERLLLAEPGRSPEHSRLLD